MRTFGSVAKRTLFVTILNMIFQVLFNVTGAAILEKAGYDYSVSEAAEASALGGVVSLLVYLLALTKITSVGEFRDISTEIRAHNFGELSVGEILACLAISAVSFPPFHSLLGVGAQRALQRDSIGAGRQVAAGGVGCAVLICPLMCLFSCVLVLLEGDEEHSSHRISTGHVLYQADDDGEQPDGVPGISNRV